MNIKQMEDYCMRATGSRGILLLNWLKASVYGA